MSRLAPEPSGTWETLARWDDAARPAVRLDGSQAASLAVGLLLWEALGRWLHFPFLPPVSQVLRAGWHLARPDDHCYQKHKKGQGKQCSSHEFLSFLNLV